MLCDFCVSFYVVNYLVFESIPMDIVPLFAASRYYCILYWPGIVIPVVMAHPPNVIEGKYSEEPDRRLST
jgi:hypothetical protein